MKNIRPYSALSVLLFLLFISSVHTYAYSLRQFSSKNGLSNSAILSIYQDRQGFMWFGSCDGMNMFDGLNIQVYKPASGMHNLSGNLIENIIEAEEGILWVQTNYGLDRFDKRNRDIQSFREFKSKNFFAVSENEDIYIINEDNYICYYNQDTRKIEKTPIADLHYYNILDVVIDRNNILWVFMIDRKVLSYQIERNGQEVTFHPQSIFEHEENLLFCSHEEDIVYFVDEDMGLYEYDLLSRKKYYIYDLDKELRTYGEIASIVKHHNDYYIGFKTSGLLRLKHTPEHKTTFAIEEIDIKSGIFCLVKDKFQDVIWVGTDGQGVFMYFIDAFSIKPTLFNSLTYPINKPIRSLFLDQYRTLWIGTKGDGIVKVHNYNPMRGSFVNNVEHLLSGNSELKNNSVYAFGASKKNILWIGTEDGLNYFSYKENKIKNIPLLTDGRPVKYIHSICEFNDSTLWMATVGDGIIKASLSGSRDVPVIAMTNRIVIDNGLRSSNYFFTSFKENDSIIWFGNRGHGAYKMNTHTNQMEAFRFDSEIHVNQTVNDIFAVHKTSEGYWFGTSLGLTFMQQDGQKQVFNESNGFPNNTIHAILEDRHNNLWLSTNQGIVKFNVKQKTFQSYRQPSELEVTEFSDGAFYRDEYTGAIMFGGVNGLITISENESSQDEYLPPILFNNLSIFGKDYNIYDFLQGEANSETLELDYSQNFFSVSFAAIDYINGNNYTYFYKLDELSDNWIENGNSNTATFTNISPGQYTLSVKYRNNITGKESPIDILSVRILPPWYKTNLTYFIYTLLALFVIYVSIRISIKWYKMKRDSMIERLNRQQKEEVYESKLRFFTNITHELCTPLTLIYGPCERIISYRRTDDYIKKYATLIQHNAEKLNGLIQELIEFRRLETGHKVLDVRRINVSELVTNIAESFVELAESRHIDYRIKVAPGVYWNSDTGNLNKILTNLISNAFKYTFDRGVIKVKLSITNNHLQMVVTNTGKGIRQENISEMFDRYKILDDFEIQSKKGGAVRNGLGLAICHSMVKLLEGEIEVTSTLNEYTTFTVILPQLTINTEAVEPASVYEEELTQPLVETPPVALETTLVAYDKSKPTIMIIDDDPSMLWFVTEIFVENHNIIPISDPKEVLPCLKVNQPNLIISDIMMPDIDGISLTKTIKSNKLLSHIPLILLSAKNDTEEQIRGIDSGAEAYVTKPFNVEYLEKIVNRLIQRKEDLKAYYGSTLSSFELDDGRFMHKEDKEFFENMIRMIDDNISDPNLSVEILSSSLGYSTRQLYRKLKSITDKTPNDIIKEYRLNLVKQLLVTTNLSVDEILYKAGFANRGNFFKLFSQKYGMTPKSYRDRKKKEFEREIG